MTSIFLVFLFIFFLPISFINFIEDSCDEKEMEYIGISIRHN